MPIRARNGVVAFARDQEDRVLLAFNQAVEDIDHRDIGADHPFRHDRFGGVDRRAADGGFGFGGEIKAAINELAHAIEDTAQDVFGIRDLHRVPEEGDRGTGRDALVPEKT